MAYLIFSTDGQEYDRQPLTGPVVLGRSGDCDISIHDILLSRRHCRIAPAEGGWVVKDLSSRNGTIVGEQKIEQHRLKTGEVIRVGKTRITFRAEAFVPPRTKPQRPALPPAVGRADETMAGTVFDLEFDEPLLSIPSSKKVRQPSPKPRPKDPASFATEDVYSMLEQIASSSWDSIYTVNAQPLRRSRLIPQPIIAGQPKPRPARPQMSLSLQVETPLEMLAAAQREVPVTQPRHQTTVHKKVTQPNTDRRRIARIGRWITRVGVLRLF